MNGSEMKRLGSNFLEDRFKRQNCVGSKLVDTSILLAMFTVILVLIIPIFSGMGVKDHIDPEQNDLTQNVDQLSQLLLFAQAESIRRGKEVVICNYRDEFPNRCDRSGDFSGWLIYAKSASNNHVTQKILRRVPVDTENRFIVNLTIETSRQSYNSTIPVIVFQPNGRPDRWGTLSFCDTVNPHLNRVITLTGAGRVLTYNNETCQAEVLPT